MIFLAQNNPNKEKAKEGLNNLRLLDGDSLRANRTVVVQSPQILNPEMKERKFAYSSFPREFTDAFFEKEFIIKAGTEHPPQAQTNKTHTINGILFIETHLIFFRFRCKFPCYPDSPGNPQINGGCRHFG